MTKYKKTPPRDSQRYSCLSPENVVIGMCYAFSWNLVEQPTQTKNGRTHIFLRDYYNMVIRRLNRLSYCDIKIYPEISSNGRFHFHGTIKIKDIVRFYLCDLPLLKHEATYEIDTIGDPKKWEEYMWKSSEFMKEFCKLEKVPYTWRKDSKELKVDALNCLKDGAFAKYSGVILHEYTDSEESSDDEQKSSNMHADELYTKNKNYNEYDIRLPADQIVTDESGPNGEIVFKKK